MYVEWNNQLTTDGTWEIHGEDPPPRSGMQNPGPESLLWDHFSPGLQPDLTPGGCHCLLYLPVPTYFLRHICVFSHQPLPSDHFQARHGVAGLLTECQATEQGGLREAAPGRWLGREEAPHLRGKDVTSLNPARRLGHHPELSGLPQ